MGAGGSRSLGQDEVCSELHREVTPALINSLLKKKIGSPSPAASNHCDANSIEKSCGSPRSWNQTPLKREWMPGLGIRKPGSWAASLKIPTSAKSVIPCWKGEDDLFSLPFSRTCRGREPDVLDPVRLTMAFKAFPVGNSISFRKGKGRPNSAQLAGGAPPCPSGQHRGRRDFFCCRAGLHE